MKRFLIHYEYKQAGAIGWPSATSATVEADTLDEARDKVRAAAYANNLEHVHCLRWQVISDV